MTAPAPFQWLATDDVVQWLNLAPIAADPVVADQLHWCILASQSWVQRYRADAFDTTDPDVTICTDADVYLAAIQQAGVLYVTRNSPTGAESFTATISYVSSVQQQIYRALRIGGQTQRPMTDLGPPVAVPAVS